MNKLDLDYQKLLLNILENGIEKTDRTGTGTISIFGQQIRHKMSTGFPLLTTKKMAWKSMVTELLWFLRGDTNIKYLIENGCHIWNGDAYKQFTYYTDEEASMERFIELIKTDDAFAKKWGELGPIYGKQWRSWGDGGWTTWTDKNDEVRFKNKTEWPQIDQFQNLINEIKRNPDSRRLMVNAWNVGELDEMVLPPCHYGFQIYTQELDSNERFHYWFTNQKPNRDVCDMVDAMTEEKRNEFLDSREIPKRSISLMFNMRSVDVPLGLPFNIASYGLLLTIIGKFVNMIPNELIGSLGDCHIYKNQVEGVKEQLIRDPSTELPTVSIDNNLAFHPEQISECVNQLKTEHFSILNYHPHPKIYFPLSN